MTMPLTSAALPKPASMHAQAPLLDVQNLCISFGQHRVVDSVSFTLSDNEVLGIVGESGSGKSLTALAMLQLLPPNCHVEADRLYYNGEDLLAAPEHRLEQLRGAALGMIFQEPMTALNPVLSIGDQIMETVRRHRRVGRREARTQALDALRRVGIPAPALRIRDYPHQLSGGMRQRVMIAMALACNPRVLIADEPTTALDVTIQAQILELMQDLQRDYQMGIILISHDLGVVGSFADRVLVMYAGQVIEDAPAASVFNAPRHPYTEGLLACIPQVDSDVQRLASIPGMVPAPDAMPAGCRFAPRCDYARNECKKAVPTLIELAPPARSDARACLAHKAACIRNTGYRFTQPGDQS